ncbi:MAG: Lrp/AsnC family transcriptional regulator [Desulfobacterales bacterium]|jgi:DNA-binding Lrp family transcriptional regulator|nr:Lrp/AsnC family transcriptional regulator [Desulfobacterales bacterium]
MLTDLEKKIIASIQEDLPITAQPYREIARRLGIAEEALLEALRGLCARGVVRRFGATLRHQRTGYKANAMAAWKVDEERTDAVGRIMAGFRQVSHCYRRNPAPAWPYNLYTMIHAEDETACRETARRMSQAAGVDSYRLLFSREELKKTSMVYFATDDED